MNTQKKICLYSVPYFFYFLGGKVSLVRYIKYVKMTDDDSSFTSTVENEAKKFQACPMTSFGAESVQ